MNNKLIVYRDPSYTSNWIDHQKADVIATGLAAKGFTQMDASGLEKWMNSTIEDASGSLVVFSQDVMPDLLMTPPDSNSLVRKYLDAGGTILWMGDIPCFYPGRKGFPIVAKLSHEDQLWFANTAFMNILGVLPVVSVPLGVVRHTASGRELGMRRAWSGVRPIIKDTSTKVLAETTSLLANEIISIRRTNIVKQFWQRISKIEISSTGASVELAQQPASSPSLGNRRTSYQKYASAWYKHYGGGEGSGFYRVWDFVPPQLPGVWLDELLRVVNGVRQQMTSHSAPQ